MLNSNDIGRFTGNINVSLEHLVVAKEYGS